MLEICDSRESSYLFILSLTVATFWNETNTSNLFRGEPRIKVLFQYSTPRPEMWLSNSIYPIHLQFSESVYPVS